MQSKTMWLLVLFCVVGLLAAGLSGGTGVAGTLFTPQPPAISYQGQLTDAGGLPLDGDYAMRFLLYSVEVAGTALWDSGPLTTPVDGGLFNVTLAVSQDDFRGEARWLEIIVEGETLAPRQPLLAAGYALGLLPGATIDQTTDDGSALTLLNRATGFALRAETSQGTGVYAYTDDNYAVYGFDGGDKEARGYGGYFYSENGVAVYGRSNASSTEQNLWAPGVYGRSTQGVGVYGRTQSTLTYMAAVRGENEGFGIGGYFSSQDGVPLYIIRNTGLGNVFEAWTLDPIARIFRISSVGNVFANGTYNSPAGDFAEMLPARTGLEPGDVLVVGADGLLAASQVTYANSVVGVYSTAPAFLGGYDDSGGESNLAPLAISGIVPVKVSDENGSIAAGDLLTTASLTGHAMRCEGVERCFGRTLGKALEPFADGAGVIKILVSIQ